MPVLMEIVDRIAEKLETDRRTVMGRVNREKKEMGVEPEAAALLIAMNEGLDVSDLYDAIDAELVAKVAGE